MKYVPPGRPGSIVSVKPRYENFIGGKWIEPTAGKYRTDLSPATAGPITEVAESTPADIAGAYIEGWKLGLKALAIYRDGSKSSQPLATTKESDRKKKGEEPVSAAAPAPLSAAAIPAPAPFRRHLPATRCPTTN